MLINRLRFGVMLGLLAMPSCQAGDQLSSRSQATAEEPMSLQDCVGMFMSDVHAKCTRMDSAPDGPGNAPSEDGRVPGLVDPTGDSSPESPAPREALSATSVELVCSPGDAAAFAAELSGSLLECMDRSGDIECGSVELAPCPPGVIEPRCVQLRAIAHGHCLAQRGSS